MTRRRVPMIRSLHSSPSSQPSRSLSAPPSIPLRVLVWTLCLGLLLALVGLTHATTRAAAQSVGAGSYADTLPAGAKLPTGCGDLATRPRQWTTSNAPAGPVPTNDWWSSILLKRTDCAYGEPMFAHPVAYDTTGDGLGLSYPTKPVITGTATGVGEYKFPYTRDLTVSVNGLDAPTTTVDDWSDWTVSPLLSDGTRSLRATIGHGLPMSYYRVKGGAARLSVAGDPKVWRNTGSLIGFTIAGHDYAAFAPTGASWSVEGTTITSTLAGKDYFTVAVLPTTGASTDTQRGDLATSYARYAHNHVTGSTVTWGYVEAGARLTTRYEFTLKAMEPGTSGTVTSLYPHQWRHLSGATADGGTYTSPRGTMKTLIGVDSFRTSQAFQGILPEVPAVATSSGSDASELARLLDQAAADPMAMQKADTYWTGKGLGRAARIAEIADQVGRTNVRDKALGDIRSTLTNWLTAAPGETSSLFYYDKAWGTLIGYPASYGSDEELNDHHFHYGYFIAAAATLAKFDPTWAQQSHYGGMIDLLIRDANNYDRADTRFPFLRDFDIYAGHDWASGHGSFASGNNQESSSEGMNFAGALIQWGQATGDRAVRDAGIYLWTTQAAAIEDYWFDVRDEVFPSSFGHTTVGMVWGDGAAYATWFSAEPEKIQGINTLPITGSHLYLGRYPAVKLRTYAELERNAGGPPRAWQDIIWEDLALADPDLAWQKYSANRSFTPEEGEAPAHTFHWIRNLQRLGTIDTSVTASHPLSATFSKSGKRTYVASNPSGAAITVRFSDGTSVNVPAGKTVATGANTWSGGNANGGTAPGTPEPTSSATPSQSPSPSTPSATPSGTPTSSASPTSQPATGGVPGYLRADRTIGAPTGRATVRLEAAGGNHDGTPSNAQSFRASGVSGVSSDSLSFDLAVDAGTAVGTAVQARVSVDLTGDGSVDQSTTYRYFAADPVSGVEHYTDAKGVLSRTGTGGTLSGGTVTLEVWTALGSAPMTLTVGDASTVGAVPAPTGGPTGSTGGSTGGSTAGAGTLFLRADHALADQQAGGAVTLPAANGNHDGSPVNPQTFTVSGVRGGSSSGITFDLWADAGTSVGQAVQARVSIDLTGDGTVDRTTTYRYFATDPVAGWEHYRSDAGATATTGADGTLAGGTVTVQVWTALGGKPVDLGVGDRSRVVIG